MRTTDWFYLSLIPGVILTAWLSYYGTWVASAVALLWGLSFIFFAWIATIKEEYIQELKRGGV